MGTVAVDEMSTEAVDEVTALVERAMALSASSRIVLARRLLQTLEPQPTSLSPASANPNPRGLSAEEMRGLAKSDTPPPDDETVKRWIHEHRMEKYG
jgi:hypothetical protein